MTALAVGVGIETGLRLRTYATLLPLGAHDLATAVEREAAENPWLERIDRSEAGVDDDEFRMVPAAGQTLVEHLELGLAAANAEPALRRAAEYIIGALDEHGYLRDELAVLARLAQVGETDVRRALTLVQRLEPIGIAARSLGERFRLQLADAGTDDPVAIALTDELEALAAEGPATFALARNLEEGRVRVAIARLRTCDPHPARHFAPPIERVYPEVVFARNGATLEARIDRRLWPQVRLASLTVPRGMSPEMREARARARLVVDALARRLTTLERLAIALLDRQRAFFGSDGDVALLEPLSGRDLARDLGCSDSTVSRALGSRYASTPFGTIALRSLLVRRPGTIDLTTRAVRERIREVVATSPQLSDEAITRTLRLRGVRLARRTVAKYRRELGLPTLRERAR